MRKLFAALCVAGIMLAGAGPALAHKPSQNAKAERACEKEGGLFVDLGGIAYACVLPTAASENDIRKDQSDVLALRVLGQLSVDEVAELLEKPPGAVRSLQHRGLATLRRKIVARTSGVPSHDQIK